MALVIVVPITGSCGWLIQGKLSLAKLSYAFYFSVAAFVIACYVLLTLRFPPLQTIVALAAIWYGSGLVFWVVKRKYLFSLLKEFRSREGIALLLCTGILSFFLFKLTYNNGLHDEYFHHALLQLFFHKPQFPFLHPHMIDQVVTMYHVGLYFPVIALRSSLHLTIEYSLDLLKIVLLLPLLPALSHGVRKTFQTSKVLSLVASTFGLLCGPALLGFDTYTANVFFGANYAQLVTPILFELAGITWFGFPIFLIFVFLVWNQLEKKILGIPHLLLLAVTICGLYLINQAFFFVLSGSIGVLFLIRFFQQRKRSFFVLFLTTVFISLVCLLSFGYFKVLFSANVLTLGGNRNKQVGTETKVRIIGLRSEEKQGIAFYDSQKSTDGKMLFSFARANEPLFWKQVGILIPTSIICAIILFQKKFISLEYYLVFLIWLVLLPLTVYYVQTPIDELALTKWLRPAFFISGIVVITSIQKLARSNIRIFLFIFFLILTISSPVFFFSRGNLEKIQRDWIIEAESIDLLSRQFSSTKSLSRIITNSSYLAFIFSNILFAQVEPCIPNCISKSKRVDYLVVDKRIGDINNESLLVTYEDDIYKVYRP